MSTKAAKFTPVHSDQNQFRKHRFPKLFLPGIKPGTSTFNAHSAKRSATAVVNSPFFTGSLSLSNHRFVQLFPNQTTEFNESQCCLSCNIYFFLLFFFLLLHFYSHLWFANKCAFFLNVVRCKPYGRWWWYNLR